MPFDPPVTIATLFDSLLIFTIVLDPPPNVHRCELRLERHRSRLDEIHSRADTFARMIASYPEVQIDLQRSKRPLFVLHASFGGTFHHPHLRGTTVHDWPLTMFSEEDAAAQLSIL